MCLWEDKRLSSYGMSKGLRPVLQMTITKRNLALWSKSASHWLREELFRELGEGSTTKVP